MRSFILYGLSGSVAASLGQMALLAAGSFLSALVTAMVAAMADRAHAVPELVAPARSAALMSNIATVVRLAVVIGALSPAMLQARPGADRVGPRRRSRCRGRCRCRSRARKLVPKRPFEPISALRFVALLTTVMLATAIAKTYLGEASLPWVLAASGLVDVHAGAASSAQSAMRAQRHGLGRTRPDRLLHRKLAGHMPDGRFQGQPWFCVAVDCGNPGDGRDVRGGRFARLRGRRRGDGSHDSRDCRANSS
ncbi:MULTISPECIES: DUF4010 domain-containing protein [unclassified Lysobacter]|uniref:DUF4010 domain-containing protein n=1 Tax=unclassified Lysobacter TaxID=2635362 RepID=UPI000AE57B5E|nr:MULTISPECIES: DUF4010 domain-containing protein [unclassified Lysobacter]